MTFAAVLFIVAVLFSGCSSFQHIKGMNIHMGVNGGGFTVPIGDGWEYDTILNISNGVPDTMMDVLQDGKLVATLRSGGVVSVRLGSWRCYGGYYYNPSWQSIPPEQSLHVSVYKTGDYESKQLWFAADRKFRLHDCNRGIRQSEDWTVK